MEKIEFGSLPPIFKISVLLNILPYYGFLHEWKEVLESMNKKTKLIWSENKEAIKHMGRDYRFKILKELRVYGRDEVTVPNCAELFIFVVDYFYPDQFFEIPNNDSWYKIQNYNRTTKLLDQLSEENGIVLNKRNLVCQYTISFWSKRELEELTPSTQCSSYKSEVKEFQSIEKKKLLEHIFEKAKSKRVVVRKLEGDMIEVNSVAQDPIWNTQNYNILNPSEEERINDYFSCPIHDWICRPTSLWWILDCSQDLSKDIFNTHDDDDNITEEVANAMTKIIMNQSLLENIKLLNIFRGFFNISAINNLIEISKKFPLMKIKFWLEYNWDKPAPLPILIYPSQLVWVFKGNECYLEIQFEDALNNGCEFIDFDQVEKEDFVVMKISKWRFKEVTLMNCQIEDNRKKKAIEKLKKITKFNDELFIIFDKKSLMLYCSNWNPREFIPIFDHCKTINIKLSPFDISFDERIKIINELPKHHNYVLRYSITNFLDSNPLNAIETSFKSFEFILPRFIIRFKKTNRIPNSVDSNRLFTVFDRKTLKVTTADSKKLTEMLRKYQN